MTRGRQVWQCICAMAMAMLSTGAMAQNYTFGVTAGDSAGEAKRVWDPLFEDLSKRLGGRVQGYYSSDYAGISRAAKAGKLDLAFVSGAVALELAETESMRVIAQIARQDGSQGYRATLMVHRASTLNNIDELSKQPNMHALARGNPESVSGYLLPESAFAVANITPVLHFKRIVTGSHQTNALALANREVDVATNNTADFNKFAKRFPEEAKQMRVIWESELIPHAMIVVRANLPEAEIKRIQSSFLGYGRSGANKVKEVAVLRAIHELEGFVAANNANLVPFLNVAFVIDRSRIQQRGNAPERVKQIRELELRHKAVVQRFAAQVD